MTVIAMTQEMATLGKDVAAGVAEALNLKLVRHELGDDVADRLKVRKKWLMGRLDTDDADFAREEIERSDSAHAARMRANFGVGLDDPLLYDVVLNTGRLSVRSCVEQVIELTRLPEFKPTKASLAHLRNLDLEARIRSALRASPESANIHITAEVDGGAVSLRGTVFTETEKKLAPKVVRGVAGVKSVSSHLRVITGAKLFSSDLE
jgi:osmotically-inducible protein OsmY